VKKVQEFQTLMNELLTTAPVTVSSYRFGVNKPERYVVEIHFVVPEQKTWRKMDKEQIVKFLVQRYGGDQSVTTGALQVRDRMMTETPRLLAEQKALRDEMHARFEALRDELNARFEYEESLRQQFSGYDATMMMEEILRLRSRLAELAHDDAVLEEE
jgi:hypothetical protein